MTQNKSSYFEIMQTNKNYLGLF